MVSTHATALKQCLEVFSVQKLEAGPWCGAQAADQPVSALCHFTGPLIGIPPIALIIDTDFHFELISISCMYEQSLRKPKTPQIRSDAALQNTALQSL